MSRASSSEITMRGKKTFMFGWRDGGSCMAEIEGF